MFRILGAYDCPYCLKAKGILMANKLPYEFEDHGSTRQKASLKQQGFATIPVIYFNGKYIGGFTELEKFIQDGQHVTTH